MCFFMHLIVPLRDLVVYLDICDRFLCYLCTKKAMKEMLSDFKLYKKMKDINEWGIFMRLCHENALMVNKMRSWLCEYGVEKQNPMHYDRALQQISDLIEGARRGEYGKAGRPEEKHAREDGEA